MRSMGSDMTEHSNIDVTMQDGLAISLAGSLVQYSTNPLVRDAMGKNHPETHRCYKPRILSLKT